MLQEKAAIKGLSIGVLLWKLLNNDFRFLRISLKCDLKCLLSTIKARDFCLFCLLLYPQVLKECLEHTRWGWWGEPKCIYKRMCIYSYMFKLQSPSKYSPLDATHLLRPFFHSPSFWTRWFWCLKVLLPFIVSYLPHQQNVSLWGLFFIQGRCTHKSPIKKWANHGHEL